MPPSGPVRDWTVPRRMPGTFEGVCALCTTAGADGTDQYYTDHGGNADACPVASCASLAECETGYYRYARRRLHAGHLRALHRR